MKLTQDKLFGYGAILISAVMFGTYGVWSHLMGPTFGPFYQAWVRSVITIAILLPIMLKTKSFRKIQKEDLFSVGIFVAFSVCTQVPLYYAFNHAPIGAVQLIFYSVYVITAYLTGSIYLKEKITRTKLVAMGLALLGLAVVFGVSALSFAPLGLALAAFNGVASGGEVSTTKKISDKYPPVFIAFISWVATFLVHLPISLAIGEKQVPLTFSMPWLWLLLYATVSAGSFWLVIEGFRHVDASIGSLIGLSEILFAIIFGALIFQQNLSLSTAIGGALVISAGVFPDLVDLYRRSRGKRFVESADPIRQI